MHSQHMAQTEGIAKLYILQNQLDITPHEVFACVLLLVIACADMNCARIQCCM